MHLQLDKKPIDWSTYSKAKILLMLTAAPAARQPACWPMHQRQDIQLLTDAPTVAS